MNMYERGSIKDREQTSKSGAASHGDVRRLPSSNRKQNEYRYELKTGATSMFRVVRIGKILTKT
jgi:hypothetical protein